MGVRIAKIKKVQMGIAYKHPRRTQIKIQESGQKFCSTPAHDTKYFYLLGRLKSFRLGK